MIANELPTGAKVRMIQLAPISPKMNFFAKSLRLNLSMKRLESIKMSRDGEESNMPIPQKAGSNLRFTSAFFSSVNTRISTITMGVSKMVKTQTERGY